MMTPVKSTRITRRSVLTPLNNQSDANVPDSSKLTPRNSRYQRFHELAELKEAESCVKENDGRNRNGTETCEDADGSAAQEVTKVVRKTEEKEVRSLIQIAKVNYLILECGPTIWTKVSSSESGFKGLRRNILNSYSLQEYLDAGEHMPIGADARIAATIEGARENTADETGEPAKENLHTARERLNGDDIEATEQAEKSGGDIDLRLAEDSRDTEDAVSNSR